MSAAQALIALIGVVVSVVTFFLMRYPQYRREEFRGEPFSLGASLVGGALMLLFGLVLVWAQRLFEGSLAGP